ncbi:hypothetical protein [Aquabacter cavernae]|uniref:hypothetical protein n=1 Tax=Aquabacter cavernae TaxID=2496029 RepID=UPI000F8E4DC7|nr:hypothetical protein [Aquabacter cavernae]
MSVVVHKPLVSGGILYSLHHLQPLRVTLPAAARDAADLVTRVSFHSHVYSQSHPGPSGGAVFEDEAGRWREFCPARHTLSQTLPRHCQDMIASAYPTWPSRDRNNINNMAVCDAQPETGERYVIFYEVVPSPAKGVHVKLIVKSAYSTHFDSARTGKRMTVRQVIKKCH